jgi:heme exporter protein D
MLDRILDFLAMGGYAVFVWLAYGATFLVMAVLLFAALRAYRQAEREVSRLQESRPRRREAAP